MLSGFFNFFSNNLATIVQLSSAAASIASGFAARKAAEDEADAIRGESRALRREAELQREQGELAAEEANREAGRVRKIRQAELSRSNMRFIKGGVTLAGSPLFVLKTQEELDREETEAIEKSGRAQKNLAFAKAGITDVRSSVYNKRSKITKRKGRSSLIGGLGQALETLTGIF